ncbi:PAP fimbrial minor pilin protein precursor [Serratia marcescens]|uniref:PAP fimbrial minor pilin protein n=2 Tax=Serratia marcescens TaxID=615 RepID=A0A379Y4M4_SERMA|nr:MrfB family protein [Serratia marcescens subsp. marcescens ATCC 13880]KFL05370.1 putative fimbrial protein MrfB [Serratia marcescens]CAI1037099.1 PAP fimbrial minor pilin protein precursor [Serratia marcescens]CAI1042656.1 PAP fimbrial minor pilin protein precursor [Serratia marcescens]CAI1908183.1 PAP fimbrial minor pilin protein precursor [Serratia marcescens]
MMRQGTVAPCLLCALLGFSSQAISASQGWGRVNMQGAILDTACAIATESREQTINMEMVPFADIIRDGQGRAVPFSIELVNCVLERADKTLPDWKQFQVTFDGFADGELFGVKGEASGIALRITDAAGNIARPGAPMPPMNIIPGSYRLNYAMTLIGNNQPLKAGDYFSAVRFKMDYY